MNEYRQIVEKFNQYHGKDGKFCTAEEDAGGFDAYAVFMEAMNDPNSESTEAEAKRTLKEKVDARKKELKKFPKDPGKPVDWSDTNISDEEKIANIQENLPYLISLAKQTAEKCTDGDFWKIEHGPRGNRFLHVIQNRLGFSDNPIIATDLEYYHTKSHEFYRGFKDKFDPFKEKITVTGKQKAEEFLFGEHYTGTGTFGDGTYVTTNYRQAEMFSSKYPDGTRSPVLSMKLYDDAVTGNLIDIMHETDAARKYIQSISDDTLSESEKNAADFIMKDWGVYAALRGYDAYFVNGGEYVILNDSKLIVNEDKLEEFKTLRNLINTAKRN